MPGRPCAGASFEKGLGARLAFSLVWGRETKRLGDETSALYRTNGGVGRAAPERWGEAVGCAPAPAVHNRASSQKAVLCGRGQPGRLRLILGWAFIGTVP